MMERGSWGKKKRAAQRQDHDFTHLIFSWSLDDIHNDDLYKCQVEKIPLTFKSEEHYFRSFVIPLLEETRCALASSMKIMHRAPFAEISSFSKAKGKEKMLYDVTVDTWRNTDCGKARYRTLPGDLFILADCEPGSFSDLQSVGRTLVFLLVNNIADDDNGCNSTSVRFKVTASQEIAFQDGMFIVFLMNITTQKRIWNSLQARGNLNIIKSVLYPDSVVKEKCDVCSFGCNSLSVQVFDPHLLNKLNESQREAIMASIHKMDCCHNSFVEQIWGPPGTGKTMTVSVMLFILLQMNCRTLTCAPTNVAILQVASRVLSLVRESFKTRTANGDSFCSFGGVLLFGNKKRLKLATDTEEIFLEHRIKRLKECLGSLTGWKHCIGSMIDLLEDCVSQYHDFVQSEKPPGIENESRTNKLKGKSFIEFVRDRFKSCVHPLRICLVTFCSHIPRSFMGEDNFQNMVHLLDNLSSLQSLLFQDNLVSENLEHVFISKPLEEDFIKSADMSSIGSVRIVSLSLLKSLQNSLGGLKLPTDNELVIKRFCFERASIIFCTTSTSYQLHTVKMEPLKLLVIDEAAQVKESESIVPLQIHGLRHAILIGDECQLPAMVNSNVSSDCGFGRSLFERLGSLGHSKHLLNVQYRMHPSISFFPNSKFYQNQILDAENVRLKSYRRRYLSGQMFGPYSFINVVGGREEDDDVGQSKRNMVEVALVIKIVQKLYQAWNHSKKKLSIGVVSPYAAQVVSIQGKLAHKYEKLDGFSVTVNSIDGFQGGEEDIIIISTVRSNRDGSVGFMSSPQRTNVAVTRARHCLWILGNERTLTSRESVWKDLVCDARNRHCLFDADADECLKKIIIAAKKELGQLDDLVNRNTALFKHVKWKVFLSNNFLKSFGKLKSSLVKNLVVDLLQKLSGGWRPIDGNIDLCCGSSQQIFKIYKVKELHVICTIDIIKELNYIQVLKVWDILPLKEIRKLIKQLDNIFAAYTDDYMKCCTEKCLEGNLEIPKSWVTSRQIIKFRDLGNCEVSMNPGDFRSYVENSELSGSLVQMKFHFLSPGMVDHLRSDREIDLPMQLTDEQMDIFLCRKSQLISGRLGTGKTTILTMKLFLHKQSEQSFPVFSEGFIAEESSRVKDAKVVVHSEVSKTNVVRQLFMTATPKLCHTVKQHVSHLTSIACNGSSSMEISFDDADQVTSELKDMPDTFVDIPEKSYPLVITFQKFLMMLDGTLGNSFFERFSKAREGSHGNHISSRSVALQTFVRLRKVTFNRFCTLYWPHFNSNLTKKIDSFRVFNEIIFVIKGGLQAGENYDGNLSYDGYTLLSEGRASTLTKKKREIVYTLYQAYEKMKSERGEFDLGDLVNDLHRRLINGNYEGDQMDFVYIDEAQDLSMRQISLFKYICQNVDEGFIFAGDTAQTIARGIDFRFQDIRSLFYKEFFSSRTTGEQEKGFLSEIFQLKQNVKTHAGVLKLAQSVIDILYCHFAHSIDILEPETSFISGEVPVLLDFANDENAIVTIFGGSGSTGEPVSFGAEQVILVRDDCAKTEICEYVGKHALVLNIAECKGLEFQDVLLYNFFGSSPLKDQWRVIYGYMKEQDWLDEKLPHSFPSFSEARHNVLCSEMKQLHVAITRTRKRLWICENKEDLSKPMFDYWKRRGLVQVRKLDSSVAQAMQRASSPQEWLERGKKLFYDNIFVMATMCFERAGDSMWEKMAKASGLRTSADQMRETNLESASCYLREAAEMFESIGRLECAAACYCDLGEYERAGKIYLDKCGQINEAAECFTVAGCYSDAAEAYANRDQFSYCLSVCRKGKLFDKGLQYVEYWKEHNHVPRKEIEQIEQEFLEICAADHYKSKDPKSMMKCVTAFSSLESKRVFLRSLGCFDELLLLEEESGLFLDAAELARCFGDVLKEADLLEKAGCCTEATMLILWYVFSYSLWGNGNRGWPLKRFVQKKKLCKKAKSLAKIDSDILYGFVCSELKVLSYERHRFSELQKHFHASQQHKSLRGEIFSIRKILDAHLHLNYLKYDWEDELPSDNSKYVEDKISHNQVSVRTLVFYWNAWKDNVLKIFQSLGSLEFADPNKHEGHVDFSLNYFGVRKHCVQSNMVYILVNKDADWLRHTGKVRGTHMDQNIQTLEGKQLVLAIRSYWQSELLSVGVKVLETLQALYNLTLKGSAFHQSTSLLHLFEVSKCLLDCQYLNLTLNDTKALQNFLLSSTTYFDFVFPLDWRKSVSEDLISLRETDLSLKLLEEIILYNVNVNCNLTYWTIGRVMMICLGSRKLVALREKIIRGLQWNPFWKSFVEKFSDENLSDVYLTPALQSALEDTHRAYCCWFPDCISPHSFVYLLERLLFVTSFSGFFFTTKSSFVEWFTHNHSTSTPSTTLSASRQMFSEHVYDFLIGIAQHILYNNEETVSWIGRSNIVAPYYHPLMVLKLLMVVCIICLQSSRCAQVLLDLLLGWNNIAYLLPQKFVCDLLSRRNGHNLNLNPAMVAEAFFSIEDPLLIVSLENEIPRVHAPSAIYVDLKRPRAEILSVLFPSKTTGGGPTTSNSNTTEALKEENQIEETGDEHSNGVYSQVKLVLKKQSMDDKTFQDAKNKKGKGKKSKRNTGSNIQSTLATILVDREDTTLYEAIGACSDLKQPCSALDMSRPEEEPSASTSYETTVQTAERLKSSSPTVDRFFNQSVMGQEWKVSMHKVGPQSSNTTEALQEENHVKKPDDEHSNGDHSMVELVPIKQSSDNNIIEDAESKKGKRKNKGKKKQKNIGCNIQSTLTSALLDGRHHAGKDTTLCEANSACNDLKQPFLESNTSQSKVEPSVFTSDETLTVQNTDERLQSRRPMVDSFLNQSILGRKWKVVQDMGMESSNPTEVLQEENHVEENLDEHSNGDHSQVELVLEKQTSNENSQDAESKKPKGRNRRNLNKKDKDSNNLNTLTTGTVIGRHRAGKDTTQCEASIACNDLKIVVEKQSSNENTQDAESKKGMGKNKRRMIKKNKDSNKLNALPTTQCEENSACNELKEPFLASNTSQPKVEPSFSTSGRPIVDFLNPSLLGREWKFVQGLGAESSNMTDVLQGENHVEESCGEHSNGDPLLMELVVEKQSRIESRNNLNTSTVLMDEQHEEITLCEANSTCNDLKLPFAASDKRRETEAAVNCCSVL